MKKGIKKFLLLAAYVVLIFAPLILMIIYPREGNEGLLQNFAVGFGLLGMSLMGLQLIPATRLKFLSRIFAMNKIYTNHHRLGIAAALIILLHPTLLIINNPRIIGALNIFGSSPTMRFGVLAFAAVGILALSSVLRKRLKIKYHIWRWLHNAMVFSAIVLGLIHMFKVGKYTSQLPQRIVWFSLIALWAGILIYIKIIKPFIIWKHPYTIKAIVPERGKSWTLELIAKGHNGMSYQAGQFAWLSKNLPFIPYDNPFSFTSVGGNPENVIKFTIKELGDLTNTIPTMKTGDTVYLDGPYGIFSLDPQERKKYVFIDGGIGSAPIMGMLRTLASHRSQKPVLFFYGNLDWESVIFREELEELTTKLDLKLVHILENNSDALDAEQGYITKEMLSQHLPRDYKEWTYYLCGPLPMLKAVEVYLEGLGVPRKSIFSERYDMA
jgi:3-phenylpropionate/trans-cinnamate dioxygenase ferredoxin reductase subunit